MGIGEVFGGKPYSNPNNQVLEVKMGK